MNFAAQMKQAEQLARENYGLVIVPKLKPHVLPTLIADPYGVFGPWAIYDNGPSGYYQEADWPSYEDSPKYDFFQPIRDHFIKSKRPAGDELTALMNKIYDRTWEQASAKEIPASVIDKPVAASNQENYRNYVTIVGWGLHPRPEDEEPHPSGIPWAMGPNDSGLVRLASGRISYRGIIEQAGIPANLLSPPEPKE